MITLRNDQVALFCRPDGRGLALVDLRRGTRWTPDERTMVYRGPGDAAAFEAGLAPLVPAGAEISGPAAVRIAYLAGQARLSIEYLLLDDGLEIRLATGGTAGLDAVALPGFFFAAGETNRLLLPLAQGVLWDGRGRPFEKCFQEGRHCGFTLAMLGCLAESGALLTTFETRDDMVLWTGRKEGGRPWCTSLQIRSLGALRYERVARLQVTDPGIVAVAKAYRARIKARGAFRSWEDKIAQRPGLERIFGSLMCFIGYCQDDLDYAAECKRLRDYGFDRALVYPAAFRTFNNDFLMGGAPPIRLSDDAIRRIQELGFDLAPWTWISDVKTDGVPADRFGPLLRMGPDGRPVHGWEMDSQRWHRCCCACMAQRQAETAWQPSGLTWDHFDVLASEHLGECYALDHAGHPGRPLSRSEAREWIRKALAAGSASGQAVSSETFNDAYAGECDFGSAKLWPQYGERPFWPVPLTALVYHDSLVHSWWEVHNYNNDRHGVQPPGDLFHYGGGRPRLMAALDALMGCPPDVFPFGAQYRWTGNGPHTGLYRIRFEEPEVQIALREALPVARLHRRIGKLEMVHFAILSEDGYLQESAFADGTRIVANFSGRLAAPVAGIGPLRGESWAAAT